MSDLEWSGVVWGGLEWSAVAWGGLGWPGVNDLGWPPF